MFSRIRKHLTFLYSGIMVFFLLTFVGFTYIGLTWAVYSEEKQELLLFAEEEAQEHSLFLQHQELLRQTPQDEYRGGRMFFYAFGNDGKLANAAEASSIFQDRIVEKINTWDVEDGDVVLLMPDVHNNRAIVMMASLPVMYGEEHLGKIYVGRDVTAFYQVLKNVFLILTIISLLFLFLASGGGYMMAGRAIIPIKKSYDRQREFVADASHELRTPLSIFMASVEAIQRDKESKISPFAELVLADMKDEIKKMSKTVSDMLTLARSDAEATTILKEKFNLLDIVEQVLRSLQPLANEKNIQLSFENPIEKVILADKERIRQLLLILLDNAIKYTPPQGKVSVGLEFSTKVPDIKIIIKDSGMGIPAEDQELIFERFYRVDKTRSREIGGTGLGLSIAKWIVLAHGGSVKIESQMGQGSTFIIILPQ
ncbi:sensor histidine kinase [Pelosinus fermentans]|uniref:histidine kinase n=1 Tax=Pelosinus fermentans JBW45 TaxID=1192197 RepID=I9NSB9_9FIRM|nr:HAMP domain-containing sensor histidine kinase [Pelosinus fermentans]AJQ27617.1 integral membrane sensor signal transduction histidine kinase [Pelosinus fermentans JBW45]